MFVYFWNYTNGNSTVTKDLKFTKVSWCFGHKDKHKSFGDLPNNSDKLPDCSARTQKLRSVTTKKQPNPNSDSQCSNWNLFLCQFAIETPVLDNLSYWMFFFNKILFVVWNFVFVLSRHLGLIHWLYTIILNDKHLFVCFLRKRATCSCSRCSFLRPLICFQSADTTFLSCTLILNLLYCKMYCSLFFFKKAINKKTFNTLDTKILKLCFGCCRPI